jgi:hypothetical protein
LSVAELIVVPAGTEGSGNLISDRAAPVVVVPTDSRQLVSKFDVGLSWRIITFAACDGVGATRIVGSIVTGYFRAGAASHARSGRTVRRSVPALGSQARRWLTLVE